ncbi:hypothetical protein [Budvicia aquatica]|uniref:Uncharacterized protein n=1 Tax=Budvicia aquatica TaxID=82979 RepID=A0A2C6DJ70_9GAMM|nr:hypothetical protein [Budvicia aquatica]MBP9643372.1 hypothetical protein [Budvicia sp.]PHI30358.1 hypothetical protein CRN84_13950 [Budvicia aquatica]GKX50460.1 hypothetical protein SOASR029_07690 [Budvicia aquatica]VFS49475.1 Uncharacterised protein [Budvicia aquatica]
MATSVLKPPLCVGNKYRRSDYGANISLCENRCYSSLYPSRSSDYSPAASLLDVVSIQKVESLGEYRYGD